MILFKATFAFGEMWYLSVRNEKGRIEKKCVSCAKSWCDYPKAPVEESEVVTDFYLFFLQFLVSVKKKKSTHCSCYPLSLLLHDIKGENPCFFTEKALQGKKLNVLKNSPTELSAPSRNDVTPFELEFLGFYDTHSFQNWQQRFFPISFKEGFGFCCFTHPDLCRIKNLDKGVCAIFSER